MLRGPKETIYVYIYLLVYVVQTERMRMSQKLYTNYSIGLRQLVEEGFAFGQYELHFTLYNAACTVGRLMFKT